MNKAKKEDYAKLKSGIIKFSREDLTEIIAAILWDIEIDKMKYIYKLLATINN